jgi:hypothetical protein
MIRRPHRKTCLVLGRERKRLGRGWHTPVVQQDVIGATANGLRGRTQN